MSKNVENVVATETAMHVLDAIREFNEGNEPTLRAFALALGIPATRLYAIAKKPIVGQVYDPDAKNWDALNEFFYRHLTDPKSEITTMEALIAAAVAQDKYLEEHAHVAMATGENLIEVDGAKMPKRKTAMFEMGSDKESLVCFKHDPMVYKMVYQTVGYTCIRAVNQDVSFAQELVRVVSNGTLNTKCVPPTQMAKAIEDRFSGAYAEQTKKSENANQNDEAEAEVETADAK